MTIPIAALARVLSLTLVCAWAACAAIAGEGEISEARGTPAYFNGDYGVATDWMGNGTLPTLSDQLMRNNAVADIAFLHGNRYAILRQYNANDPFVILPRHLNMYSYVDPSAALEFLRRPRYMVRAIATANNGYACYPKVAEVVHTRWNIDWPIDYSRYSFPLYLSNEQGEIEWHDAGRYSVPTLFGNVKKISANSEVHAAAVTESGQVITWGSYGSIPPEEALPNGMRQWRRPKWYMGTEFLGQRDSEWEIWRTSQPPSFPNWSQTSRAYTLAEDVPNPSKERRYSEYWKIPGNLVPEMGIKDIQVTSRAIFVLTNNGAIFVWGEKSEDETESELVLNYQRFATERRTLPDGTHETRLEYIPIGHTVVQTPNPFYREGEDITDIPADLRSYGARQISVCSASSGDEYGLAVTNYGAVVAWGSNRNGQRDVPNDIRNGTAGGGVRYVYAARYTAYAVMNDGTVRQWGWPVATLEQPGRIISLHGHIAQMAIVDQAPIAQLLTDAFLEGDQARGVLSASARWERKPLRYVIEEHPNSGSVTVNHEGVFTYRYTGQVQDPSKEPLLKVAGERRDTFTWYAVDHTGLKSNIGTVVIKDWDYIIALAQDRVDRAKFELDQLRKLPEDTLVKMQDGDKKSADPIVYSSGEIDMKESDLGSSSERMFSLRRTYTNVRGDDGSALGYGWHAAVMPTITWSNPFESISAIVVLDANRTLRFAPSGTTATSLWICPLDSRATLRLLAPHTWMYADGDGSKTVFERVRYFVEETPVTHLRPTVTYDPRGNPTYYRYHERGEGASGLKEIERPLPNGESEKTNYQWTLYPVHLPSRRSFDTPIRRLRSVEHVVMRGQDVVRRLGSVSFDYYVGNDAPGGLRGQLKSVIVHKPDPNGTMGVVGRFHYRYWRERKIGTSSEQVGIPGGLRYAIGPRRWSMMEAQGLSPLEATDDQLALWCDKAFEYDARGRVTRQSLRTADIDGSGVYTYAYTENPRARTAPRIDGVEWANRWAMKTAETMPDGSIKTVYTGISGDALLTAVRAYPGGPEWLMAHRYNGQHQRTWDIGHDALTGYNESTLDLLEFTAQGRSPHVRNSSGKIMRYGYYALTGPPPPGGIRGQIEWIGEQIGDTGPLILSRRFTYESRSGR